MKYLLLFLIAPLLIVSCTPPQTNEVPKTVIFSGIVKNSGADSLAIQFSNMDLLKKIAVDSNGAFADTLIVEEGPYTFQINRQRASLYLIPGGDLHLQTNYDSFDSSLTFTGSLADANSLLLKKTMVEINNRALISAFAYASGSEEEFLHGTDSLFTLYKNVLNSYDSLPSQFKKYVEADLAFDKKLRLAEFESLKQYVSEDSTFKVSAKYPKIDFNFQEDATLKGSISYTNFIETALVKKHDLGEKENYDFEYLKAISSDIKSQDLKDELMYTAIKWSMNRVSLLDSVVAVFNANVANEDYKAFVNEKYEALALIQPGMPSPTFNLPSHNGDTVSLESLKGKLVYIDLWATWCGPCIREIPFLKETEKAYHDANIAFVSISTNDNREKWNTMVSEKELGGIQLFADNDNNQFVKDYQVTGIPHFILLDENGKIIDNNAKRPSNPELRTQLDALLSNKAI